MAKALGSPLKAFFLFFSNQSLLGFVYLLKIVQNVSVQFE